MKAPALGSQSLIEHRGRGKLLSPRISGTNVAPGDFAGKAQAAKRRLGRKAILRPGTFLDSMSDMEVLREPTPNGTPVVVKRGNILGFINQKKANIKALLAQRGPS